MKKQLFLIATGIGVILYATGSTNLLPRSSGIPEQKITCSGDCQQNKDSVVNKVYTCPMHPEIIRDKPAQCPKCGMDLVAKEVQKSVYTCPMHPEIIRDKQGKCPKCGMDLVLKEPAKKPAPPKK